MAMASIWKGALVFGLVNVQVKLHPATEDNDVAFHQVHAEDGGRIRYRRVCEICGETVEYREIAKAYESSSGKTVIVTEDDLSSLPAARSREIDVIEFVPSDQVDPIRFDRSYYLEPDPSAVRPYVLLREALRETDRTAITRVALRTKTRLAALRVKDDVIVLQTMLWDDEIRKPNFAVLKDHVEVRAQELKMAASLVQTLEADFKPEQFHDDYREELLMLLEKKLESGDDAVPDFGEEKKEQAAKSGNVVDLMSALQASIDRGQQSKAAGGIDSNAAESAEKKSAAEKSGSHAAGVKPPAKKAAAKKTPAKKAPPKTVPAKQAPEKRARKGA